MFLLLFNLIQAQQPRLSPFVIAGAVLAFIVGVGLLVYFFRRLKTSEKEAEEDWSLSRRSLFVQPEPVEQKAEEFAAEELAAEEPTTTEPISPRPINPEPVNQAATEELASHRTGEFHEVTNEQVRGTEELRADYSPAPDMTSDEAPIEEQRPTQVLASIQPDDFNQAAEATGEPAPFDEEVWAGLETHEQQTAPPVESDSGTQLLGSDQVWPAMESRALEEEDETRRTARVDGSASREPFEPPRIERVLQREPFEPPIIKLLTPREQSTFIETQRESSPARYEEAARSDERDEAAAPPIIYPAPADRAVEPSVAAPQVERAAGHKSRAGSILGLPAEASQGPLILGEPVRAKEERGIGALSSYGKPLERDGGRGGTIALLAVVLVLGGGMLAYFFIPSIHNGLNGWVARVRGTDVEEARRAAMTPKAIIYPRFNSEVVKNQIKIKGAVDNIWSEPLENLTVEVTLVRGADATPQVIPVTVNPNPLPPNQRGTFDFEYDGKRDTGFTGYKITRLFSNGNEVKFTSPNAQK